MQLQEFKEIFDPILEKNINERIDSINSLSSHTRIHNLLKQLLEISRGGKRLRPYVLFTAAGYKKSEDILVIQDYLIAIELLHIFALIHDDIIDMSETRHGTLTIEAWSKKYPTDRNTSPDDHGRNEAILIGDLVFSWSYYYLHKQSNKDIQLIFNTLIEEVILGQTLDIELAQEKMFSKEALATKMLLKTGRYSFARPMQIGAILGSKSKTEQDIIFNLGEKLGILFQLTDDLLDITGDPITTQKPIFQDIENNQATIISLFCRNHSPQLKNTYDTFVGKKLTPEEQKVVRNLLEDNGIIEQVKSEIELYKKEAEILIKNLSQDTQLWENLLDKIINRHA